MGLVTCRRFIALCVLTCCLSGAARAQLLHLDPLPWPAPADTTSRLAMVAQVDRFQDNKFDWRADRLLVTAVLPAGERAAFFLRIPHVTFDTGRTPLLVRWPWLQGPDADADWPGEGRVASFGQLEVGIVGPLGLFGLRRVQFGVALGLPTGSDRLYPLSSTSLPLRCELRRNVALASLGNLALTAGRLVQMSSGKDYLAEEFAFRGGNHLGASLSGGGFGGGRYELAYDYVNREGHRSQKATVAAWWPWQDSGSVGLRATHEFQGTLDRYATWIVSVLFRVDSVAAAEPVPAGAEP